MAFAFCVQNQAGIGDDGTGLVIVMDVIFSGNDVPGGRVQAGLRVNVPADASPVQIRQAITAEVQAEAARQGFNAPATGITQPAYSKG